MTIEILLTDERIPIRRSVFERLLGNSVKRMYASYHAALDDGTIHFTMLLELARDAEIPYPLFFAPEPVVEAQLRAKTAALMQGVPKGTFAVNSRDTIDLADVELIVKDLLRKQGLVKKFDRNLPRNPILGKLSRSRRTDAEDAQVLLDLLGLTTADIHACRDKESARDLLIARLEANQILVALSVDRYMPQSLRKVKFSGLTVKDNKVPYIFVASGSEEEKGEPFGRQIFTIGLMAALVARKQFAPVVVGTSQLTATPPREYGIVSEMLMPSSLMRARDMCSLAAIQTVADEFKVTPSAVVVRAAHLKQLSWGEANDHLLELAKGFASSPSRPMRSPYPSTQCGNTTGESSLGACSGPSTTPI
ncbi:hypothetical protein G7085_00110 [Tessaracoccus sp. HDW20]|uniref:hypothetical protein n=1 Tax=Tessaracoccus coleopterorum TaxID=2714950 RepID=UPI0018D4D07A|nr:hypothetical protein [Tessaracoccus coleopterorum]NHB83639.1 hypothetical protein [Tessaracoccus coleopterorum]